MTTATILRSPWALSASIVVWTSIAWGGRISLLTGGEEWGSWLRIGGSLLIGSLAVAALLLPVGRLRRPLLYLFVAWSIVIWARSSFVTWSGSGSITFKLVHTLLACGFFALAWWAAWSASRGHAVARPDEGHGQ